ncbi:MAG TPA: type II secretion system protein GspK [bacterium]|nr:type II secretion system protein GspK [bacterium]
MKKISKKNRGIVLVFVLVVVLAMSTMVLFFQNRTRGYIDVLSASSRFQNMDSLAEIGIEIGKEIIAIQQSLETSSISADRIWPKEKIYEAEGMNLHVTVEDENGKINPNRIFGEEKGEINGVLQNIYNVFFAVTGYPETLRDSMLDWIDEDDIPRQNGAESFHYRTEGLPYTPPNRKFYTAEEILLVRDCTEEIFYGKDEDEEEKKGLVNFVSIISDGKINVNRCSPEILNAMGFTSANVERILAEREGKPLAERDIMSINREAYTRNRNAISFKSSYYCISSKVTDREGREKMIKAYIRSDDKKTDILRWTMI